MKNFLILCLILYSNLGCSQIAFYNSQLGIYNAEPKLHLQIMKKTTITNPTVIILRRYVSVGLALSATTMFLVSKKTYNEYKNFKNDIVYTSNSFTQVDLQKIDEERLKILEKANSQKKIGFGISTLCIISFGVSYIFPPNPAK
jgi:hypothetical protein